MASSAIRAHKKLRCSWKIAWQARSRTSPSYPYGFLASSGTRDLRVAQLIAEQKVLGLFLGRMEFGPRALGHRSIIGDVRSVKMQSIMNLKIKYRESFRPFAPSVLIERAAEYFELDSESPYMLLVAPVRPELHAARADTAGNVAAPFVYTIF